MTLEHAGSELLKLENRLFLWIDVKRFRLSEPGVSGPDALALLIKHPQYRDHYTSSDSQSDDGVVHGPYRRSRISTESFNEVDLPQAIATIDEFLALYGGPADGRAAEIRDHLRPLLDSASVAYRLRDLGEDAQHEAGWVLTDFTELVLLDPAGGELILIVAAGD